MLAYCGLSTHHDASVIGFLLEKYPRFIHDALIFVAPNHDEWFVVVFIYGAFITIGAKDHHRALGQYE